MFRELMLYFRKLRDFAARAADRGKGLIFFLVAGRAAERRSNTLGVRHCNYFDNWQDEVLVCPRCGWRGKFKEGSVTYYRDLMDCGCPSCSTPIDTPLLAIVWHPTVEEAKAHWDQLTEDEKQVVTTRSRWEEEFQARVLDRVAL